LAISIFHVFALITGTSCLLLLRSSARQQFKSVLSFAA